MDRAWLRAAQKLEFKNPTPFLAKLRHIEQSLALSQSSKQVRNLRTNALKEWREMRQAALFCYGVGQRIGQTVYLARGESHDYDFVASWIVEDEQHFAPVQLKEVVPAALNPNANLQATVNSLGKYVDSAELTVAIHLNQATRLEPGELVIPELRLAALWVFAAITADQSAWGLWGNFLEQTEGSRFEYPA